MATQAAVSASARTDRIPPYSEEAERGVLGSALLDPARVIDLCTERQIQPDSFYVPAHRELFEVLLKMHDEGRPVDLLTVGERLRDSGMLEEIGGAAFIERLVDSTPTDAHAEYYIDIVRQKFLFRSIIDRARRAIEACYLADEDADAILDATEQSFFDISEFQRSTVVRWSDAIKETMESIEQIIQQKKGITGIATGYQDLDRITMGFQPSDMIIIAARPSMGKTSLAMNIAENVALGATADHKQRPVAIFSLEMSREQLVRRMLCSKAGIPTHKLAGGYISNESHGQLVRAADALMNAPLFVDDSGGMTAIELRARARRLKRKYNIEMVVVDYLQMLHYPQFAKEGRQRETAAISGALKAMAKELRIPVVVLSQLSRAPETRDRLAVPKLSDLRDSGSIEQDADVVCLLRRPCKYPDDKEFEDKTLAVLDVAKHRNGPTGEIRLNFIEECTRFEPRTEIRTDPQEGFAPSSGGI